MAPALTIPRSAVLAAWLGLGGDPTRAARCVQGDDEPHTVQAEGRSRPLAEYVEPFLRQDGRASSIDTACQLPVPGDPAALGPAVAAQAITAGEAVLLRGPDGCRALIPQIRQFGSQLEPGHVVTWVATPVLDWRRAVAAATGGPREAEQALQQGLAEATAALVRLDVARWSPLSDQVEAVRDAALPVELLPPTMPGARLRMLATAARVRAIVGLAATDTASSPSVFVADQRAAALRETDRAARRALAASTTFVAATATM
ncbi:MAG: hypothetical protein KJ792_09150 [Actinobacteria bacterium]|nr:hypothetical protein [Actinomycetota bacterium]MCG2801407.1 hypothetical protein [Cellulomonas sp.]